MTKLPKNKPKCFYAGKNTWTTTQAELDELYGIKRDFKKEAEDVFDKILQEEMSKPHQLKITGLPTDLCRTTIFMPLPRRDRKKIQSAPVKKIFETGWSRIKYTGYPLSVDDEDLLLVVLLICKKRKSREILVSFTELQEELGMKPHQSNNQKIKDALERLYAASIKVEFKKDTLNWRSARILSKNDAHKRQILVEIDKRFFEKFVDDYTIFSLETRLTLESAVTKLLYTFLCSHRNPERYELDTLIEVLNLNKDAKRKHLKQQLREAFDELQSQKILKYKIQKDCFVIISILIKRLKQLT